MGAIRNIVIAVLIISGLTFVALFGQLPALRKTPVGWLHRLLRHHVPAALARVDDYATGGKISAAGTRLGNYLFYRKNPVVLIIFLVLLTGSAGLFLRHALPLLPTRFILPIPTLLVQPYLFTWLSAAHKGHHINPDTHQKRMHDYPYDHLLFRPSHNCSTCHLTKPARSKHCSLCGKCIAMCDHHCPWINNCVGRGNYRHFLALLFSLGVLEVYGAYLSWWILKPHFQIGLANSIFSSAGLRDLLRAATIAVNVGGISIAGVGMLTAATGALPFALLLYHCYLIWAGMTTNESQKWADWREDMRDGWVFKANRKALRRYDSLRSNQFPPPNQSNGSASELFRTDDEPFVPWATHSDQVVIFREDGRPPPGEEALWTRIWKLEDVDNIYDLGGWTNFMEVLRGR